MKKQKIYISGKITGDEKYMEKFRWAEALAKFHGFKTVNPTKGEKVGKPWDYYMKRDIVKLTKCDAILLIQDWAMSRGARIERRLAIDLGLDVYNIINNDGVVSIVKEVPPCEEESQD